MEHLSNETALPKGRIYEIIEIQCFDQQFPLVTSRGGNGECERTRTKPTTLRKNNTLPKICYSCQ